MTTAAQGALITVAAICAGVVWLAGELAIQAITRTRRID